MPTIPPQLDEVCVKAWNNGKVVIRAQPRDPAAAQLWGVRPLDTTIQLPGPVRADSAQALMTLHGQLYVRLNDP